MNYLVRSVPGFTFVNLNVVFLYSAMAVSIKIQMDCSFIKTRQTRTIETMTVIVITMSVRLQVSNHLTAVALIFGGY